MGMNYKVILVTGVIITKSTTMKILGMKRWNENKVHEKIQDFNRKNVETQLELHRLHGEVSDSGHFFDPQEPNIVLGYKGALDVEHTREHVEATYKDVLTTGYDVGVYAGICTDCCV